MLSCKRDQEKQSVFALSKAEWRCQRRGRETMKADNKMTTDKPRPAKSDREDFIREIHPEDNLLDRDDTYLKAFEPSERDKKRDRRGAFGTLLSLYRGSYGKIALGIFCKALDILPPMYMSVATSNIINLLTYHRGESGAAWQIVFNLAVVLIGCCFINPPLDQTYAKIISKVVRVTEANLRSSLIRKMHMLSIGYYKRIQSGRLQSKIMRDVEAISQLSNSLFSGVVNIVLTLLFTLTVTAIKDPRILLLYVVIAPISVLVTQLFRKRLRESNANYRQEMENTSASVMEVMELIPVTKAHGEEDVQVEKVDRNFERVAKDGYRVDVQNAVFGRAIWLCGVVVNILALSTTSFLAWKGIIRVGDVVLYNSYLNIIVGDINGMLGMVPVFTKGMESVNSVGDVLTAADIEDNYHKLKPPRLKGEVEFDDVSFRYDDDGDDRPVLRNFNLKVKAGETIALVGASGCGKTTAINLIIGFGKATEGRVLIDGMNINNFNLHAYRSQLAVVPQMPILFSGTIRDNITYGNEAISDEQLMKAIEQANLGEFIASLPQGVDTVVGEHGGTLSGGQRQRIAIARALVRDPSIVILDEATSALDTVSERKIQVAIDNVAHGRTTFIVAHRLSTIRHADRIIVVQDGHPIESGTFEELMALGGEFYKLQTMQDE